MRIDINSDMGEGFGAWSMGDDAALLKSVSSANIACGFHAGDPRVMFRTVQACAEAGVAIGAHPGFPDLVGFGRRPMQCSADELRTDVIYQIGALQAMCTAVGVELHHVKPHGAMYNMAAADYEMSVAIIDAVATTMSSPLIYAQAGSETARAAGIAGVQVACEVFADRAYLGNGQLAPRSLSGALLHDVEAITARAIRMVHGQPIPTIDRGEIVLNCDTICVHGDTEEAVEIAKTLRESLESAGFTVSPL
ncbi:MAG: LamB/YcsF family protein [Thermomicrobiales bacterium]|nr:LamB/YcsF family protein [Thermomicrobiales bacterium]